MHHRSLCRQPATEEDSKKKDGHGPGETENEAAKNDDGILEAIISDSEGVTVDPVQEKANQLALGDMTHISIHYDADVSQHHRTYFFNRGNMAKTDEQKAKVSE